MILLFFHVSILAARLMTELYSDIRETGTPAFYLLKRLCGTAHCPNWSSPKHTSRPPVCTAQV